MTDVLQSEILAQIAAAADEAALEAVRVATLGKKGSVSALLATMGSLSPDERLEIESHVTHTFRFLTQIPWTRSLKRVPEIAHGHHEKLDGRGYQQSLAARVIPVQSKMMAIADIYDALTASDRPYTRAVPHEAARRILRSEAGSGQLDAALLDVFIEAEIPRRALDR